MSQEVVINLFIIFRLMLVIGNNITNANEMVIWPCSKELQQHRKHRTENKICSTILGI